MRIHEIKRMTYLGQGNYNSRQVKKQSKQRKKRKTHPSEFDSMYNSELDMMNDGVYFNNIKNKYNFFN